MCDSDGCGAHKRMPPIIVPDAERRAFLRGLAALPLAAVLFDPLLARAQGERLEMASIPVPGAAPASGALALPEANDAPALILVHEW